MNISKRNFLNKQAAREDWFSGSVVIYQSLCLTTSSKRIEKFEALLRKSRIVIGESCFDDTGENIIIKYKKEYLDELDDLEKNSIIKLSEACEEEIEDCKFEDFKVTNKFNFTHDEYDQKNIIDERLAEFDFSLTEKGISITINNREKENLILMSDLDGYNEELKREQYGKKYFEDRIHFVLRPVSFCYADQEASLAYFTADTFSNGMIVFRVIIPVKNQPVKLIGEGRISSYVKETILPSFFENKIQEKTNFYSILESYIREICEGTGYEMFCVDNITHYVVTQSSYKIKEFNRVKEQTKEELFKLINVPYNHENTLKEDTKEFFQKQVFGKDYIKTLVSKKGVCISVCEEDKKFVVLENATNNETFFYRMVSMMQFSELAITIMTMLKLNYKYTYQWLNLKRSTNDIIAIFRSNLDYIYSLYEDCYGSVKEQIDFMKRAMNYYLSEEIYLNRIKYVQENLKDKKEKQVSNISLSISLVTVLFTIIFGLPAIVETCTIFVNNSFMNKEKIEAPISIPICIWVATIVCIFSIWSKTFLHEIKQAYSRTHLKVQLRYNMDLNVLLKVIFKNLKGVILLFLSLIIEIIGVLFL